jgi:hypothetical protein
MNNILVPLKGFLPVAEVGNTIQISRMESGDSIFLGGDREIEMQVTGRLWWRRRFLKLKKLKPNGLSGDNGDTQAPGA